MIDYGMLDMLESPDVETRKRGIKALAKTRDRDALVYLADVYRNDSDDAVREMARKAGIYIKKNAPPALESEPEPAHTDLYDGETYEPEPAEDRLYEDDVATDYGDEPVDDMPTALQMNVSNAARSNAKSMRDQALDFSTRGNDARAAELLEKAFRTDPQLMQDSYTRSIAASVTGMPQDEAIKHLGPSSEELRRQQRGPAVSASRNPVQAVMIAGVIVSAVVALFGYLFFPWVDIGSVPVPQEDGTTATINEGLSLVREAGPFISGGDPSIEAALDALDELNFSPNGWNTTLYANGFQNILEYFGFVNFILAVFEEFSSDLGIDSGELRSEIDNVLDEFSDEISISPEPLDYSLLLVPVTLVLAALMGGLLFARISLSRWAVCIVFGLLGVLPLIYFYLSGLDGLIDRTVTLTEELALMEGGADAIGDLAGGVGGADDAEDLAASIDFQTLLDNLTTDELIGAGFWITLAGMLGVLLLPFIALLTIPEAED